MLVNEAELRHWKSHAMVELLLEFAGSAMKLATPPRRSPRGERETLHTVTYENFQQGADRTESHRRLICRYDEAPRTDAWFGAFCTARATGP
ncbi:hypothetical protein ABZ595_37310 [Streptomyces rubradiris]|uniref:hypothetical protein n=1 Tax=Streptomyces rubradiris TaxID=285531 RepID=UPI0033FCE802